MTDQPDIVERGRKCANGLRRMEAFGSVCDLLDELADTIVRLCDEAASHARLMSERAQQIVTLEAEVERLSEHIRLERKYQELAYLAERRLEHVLMNCTITCNHEYDADGREAATRIRTTDDIDNRMGEQ